MNITNHLQNGYQENLEMALRQISDQHELLWLKMIPFQDS
jgi:hypothetical protein